MFYGASAFDQDLGWCTLATVDRAFHTSPCQSNDCGVLRGVRVLGACEPEKTPAPTLDPEGRVCNGGPYDGRRCDRHDFCQRQDPNQPDVDACDDCKCITRKDSDGAARTSSSGCFFVFVLFFPRGINKCVFLTCPFLKNLFFKSYDCIYSWLPVGFFLFIVGMF